MVRVHDVGIQYCKDEYMSILHFSIIKVSRVTVDSLMNLQYSVKRLISRNDITTIV